MQCRKKYYCRN